MTDHEKLMTVLWSEDDSRSGGEVSVFDVMAMLYELGEEHRRIARRQLVVATA